MAGSKVRQLPVSPVAPTVGLEYGDFGISDLLFGSVVTSFTNKHTSNESLHKLAFLQTIKRYDSTDWGNTQFGFLIRQPNDMQLTQRG